MKEEQHAAIGFCNCLRYTPAHMAELSKEVYKEEILHEVTIKNGINGKHEVVKLLD